MFVEVTVTRHTKVGTFRPDVIYGIKDEDRVRRSFVNAAVKKPGSVFKILSKEEAEKRQKEIVALQKRPSDPKLGVDKRTEASAAIAELKSIIQDQAEEISTYKADATQTALDLEEITKERDELKDKVEALERAAKKPEAKTDTKGEKAEK